MKMVKSLIISMLIIATMAVTAAAAPESLPYGYTGNTTGLITVTNPSVAKAATVENSYIVSGYGKNGVYVTLYRLSGNTYYKTGYEWSIGASGLFYKQIMLWAKNNAYLCYAESGVYNQAIPFEINSLNNISIKVDPNSLFIK